MVRKQILCAYGVHVDAVAGWLGSYGGEDSPGDISRGIFAGEVGTPRLLKLFDRLGIKTSWFIPGHSIESFPNETRMIAEAGHEIGIHGYCHENPIAMTAEQEEAVLTKVHRPHHTGMGTATIRLRCSVVGVQPLHRGAASQARYHVRQQPHAPRL